MKILEKLLKILPKKAKKEENPKIHLEIIDVEPIPEPFDVEPNPNIIYRHTRIKTPLSHYIKQALRWLNLKDATGEEIIKEEDDINLVFGHWAKSLIGWFINIVITGMLIYIALLPFYSVPLFLVPFVMFSFGLLYFIIIESSKELSKIVRGKHG